MAYTGGKSIGLSRLDNYVKRMAHGSNQENSISLSVPLWFELSTDFFADFCIANSIDLADPRPVVYEQILQGVIPKNQLDTFTALVSSHFGTSEIRLAIRSNANVEDGADASFAGIFSSEIGVAKDSYAHALKSCWSSFYSSRATHYFEQHHKDVGALRCSLVIQECVEEPQFSGVAFSRVITPRGTLDQAKIEIIRGYGEDLVSGAADPITFTLERRKQLWSESGSDTLELKRHEREQLMLVRHELAQLMDELELMYGFAVDMEFSIRGNQVLLLQMRPVTHIPPLSMIQGEMSRPEQITVWDHSNIAESYPGQTLPLTFSHLKRSYKAVYRQFAQVMGVTKANIAHHDEVFSNMIGLCYGRVYYNLFNWYRLIYLLPNAERSSGFMEGMMGVQQTLGEDADILKALFQNVRRPTFLQNIAAVVKGVFQLLTCQRQSRVFVRDVGAKIEKNLATPFASLSVVELMQWYQRFSMDVIESWRAPILNDTACMLYSGFCKNLLKPTIAADQSLDHIFSSLIENRVEVFSSLLIKDLSAIAQKLNDQTITGRDFVLSSAFDSLESLKRSPHHDLYVAVKSYVQTYGFRVAEELKLESKDLHIDFSPFITALRTSLQAKPEISRATTHAVSHLRKIPAPKRILLTTILNWTAQAIADRERMRYLRTEAFAVAKRIFAAMGAKLADIKILADADDIHYLTIEELEDFIHGRVVSKSFAQTVNTRRKEYQQYGKLDLPGRFLTRGPSGAYLQYPALVLAQSQSFAKEGDVVGTPCSPGLIEGQALVAMNFAEAKDVSGQILIAKHTDPAWITLYPACKALVIECGSSLSHAVVVAREMGIPTIVGARGITSRVKSGDTIRINGSSGVIEMNISGASAKESAHESTRS